jgi:hypothetical protein
MDLNINDPAFATAMADRLHQMITDPAGTGPAGAGLTSTAQASTGGQ